MAEQDFTEKGHGQIQNILNNERFQDARQNLFRDALLNQLVDEHEHDAIANIEEIISIAFRIEQIAIRLWASGDIPRASQAAKDSFETSAKLFEQLAEVQTIPSRWVHLELYLHSAIGYSLGEFQANSAVMARKVLEEFEFETDTYSIVLHAAFLLLHRDIHGIEHALSELLKGKTEFERERQELLLSFETRDDALEEIAHFITLEAIFNFSRYLAFGRNELFDEARTKIANALELFTEIRDPDNYVLTQLISLLFRQMHFASLWHQLGDLHGFRSNRYLNRYLQVLTNDKDQPIYELWQSQIDALEKVLGDSNAVVLQMPTSAGKTRIAEIDIMNKLAASDQRARCIYVAPYKSLAAQVERSLDRYLSKVGYRVTTIFGSFESVEFEDTLIDQNDILVITPEKLDYLLRQNEELFQTVKLIVIDEGHILDNDVRGLRLEFLLERIRRRFTDHGLKILFISAVIPNSEEISTWLTQGEPVVANSTWKPTRLRQGIFYWGYDWQGRIRYLEEHLTIITDLARSVRSHHLKTGKRLKNPVYSPDSSYDIAIELTLSFIKASPIIIFTAVRKHIDGIAQNFDARIKTIQAANETFHLAMGHQSQLEMLAQKIESRLGKDFPLANYIREGFAYHHGLLPDDIRQDIEESFRSGTLPVLITTTTLAHGINLPVRLMIVANLNRGPQNPFLVRDFRNIAGRSGRALHETEGQVILINNSQSEWLVEERYKYLLDDRMEDVQSVLFKLYEQIIQSKLGMSGEQFRMLFGLLDFDIEFSDADIEPQSDIDFAFQTQIMALLYEELLEQVDPEVVREMLGQTLFGIQKEDDWTYYAPLVNFTQTQIRYVSGQFKSELQKRAFYKTGLSLRSCQYLEEQIADLMSRNIFSQIRDSSSHDFDMEKLREIFNLAVSIRETQTTYNKITVDLAEAFILWINYADVNDLVNRYRAADDFFQNPLSVSDLIYRHFINNVPWGLNSVIKILQYLQEERGLDFDSEIRLLPAYAKYGVNTPVASYVGSMGIFDREVARRISDYYSTQTNNFYPDIESFYAWAETRTFEDLLPILQNATIVSIVLPRFRRYHPGTRLADYFADPNLIDFATYIVGLGYENRLENMTKISIGESLVLVREANNEFDPNAMAVHTRSGLQLGYVRRDIAFILSTLYDEGWRFNCIVTRINNYPSREIYRRLLVRITTII